MQLINNILSSFKRELHEIIHDRLYRAIMLVIPFVMILFFTLMFYRGEIVDLPIAVVDKSHSPMSRKLLTMIDATQGVKIAYETQSIEEAKELMLHGEALAIIYIDKDFEPNIFGGIPTKVKGYTLGTNISADGVIESNIQQAVMTLSSGITLNKLQAMGVGHNEAMVEIMPINILSHIVANPYLNYGYYLAPLFMFMGIAGANPLWFMATLLSGHVFAVLLGAKEPHISSMIQAFGPASKKTNNLYSVKGNKFAP